MNQGTYTKVSDECLTQIEEYYKCHYTRKEIAKEFGLTYNQVTALFYKFKHLKKIKKYDRLMLAEVFNGRCLYTRGATKAASMGNV